MEVILTAALAALCLILAAAVLFLLWYAHHAVRKVYETADGLLDDILRGRKITAPELKEGMIHALAGKAVRIQQNQNAAVSQSEQEKQQVKMLISNMSHQLKTPLANVMLYEDLLIGKKQMTEVRKEKILHQMRMQTERIDWILNSLFKMVKLEQDTIEFAVAAYPVKGTLLAALSTVYEKALKKDISFFVQEFEDVRLLHHPEWTQEVFVNLLENAVKYSPNGTQIQIRLQKYEMYSVIQIMDHGIGIPKAEQQKIFFRFYRGSNAENYEGSGIGLYLSRLIIEKENGYINVSSMPQKGSCFQVFLQNECLGPGNG